MLRWSVIGEGEMIAVTDCAPISLCARFRDAEDDVVALKHGVNARGVHSLYIIETMFMTLGPP